jgi:hypothetical protein
MIFTFFKKVQYFSFLAYPRKELKKGTHLYFSSIQLLRSQMLENSCESSSRHTILTLMKSKLVFSWSQNMVGKKIKEYNKYFIVYPTSQKTMRACLPCLSAGKPTGRLLVTYLHIIQHYV